MSAPCSLASADQLKELMRQGGFQQVRLRIDVVPARISALGAFLVGQFLASPVAADIGALDESVRGGLLDDIQRRLRPYLDDSGLAVPFEAHTITASR